MNTRIAAGLVVLAGCWFSPPLHGATATGLSSFEAIEEPVVRYFPARAKFEADAFVNIVEVGAGVFRMHNRFRDDWWDGDRDTTNRDRQRAEVKGLGPHQFQGETFEYALTWRTNAGFRAGNGFCHLFQLKATNGDSASPLITLSLRGDKATVEANPDGPKIVAREFSWKAGTWQVVRIRVKTSAQADGELLVSVNGDAFQGKTGVALSRPEANEYRPKWGLYRRAAVNAQLGEDYVEHKDVSACKVSDAAGATRTTPCAGETALETEARVRMKSASPEAALAWLQAQPAAGERDLAIATIAARWAETRPSPAMTWVERLPPGAVRRDAVSRVFFRWADQDLGGAAQWLHNRAPGPEMDSIVWLFTTDTTYRYVQREIALAALPLIKDPALRAQALEHVVEIWSRTERAAALSFVEQSSALSVEQKKTILERLRAKPPAK